MRTRAEVKRGALLQQACCSSKCSKISYLGKGAIFCGRAGRAGWRAGEAGFGGGLVGRVGQSGGWIDGKGVGRVKDAFNTSYERCWLGGNTSLVI